MTTPRRTNTEPAPHFLTKPGDAVKGTFAMQSKRMREFNARLAHFEKCLEEQEGPWGCNNPGAAHQQVENARQELRRFVRTIK